jgi:hypothetical protein
MAQCLVSQRLCALATLRFIIFQELVRWRWPVAWDLNAEAESRNGAMLGFSAPLRPRDSALYYLQHINAAKNNLFHELVRWRWPAKIIALSHGEA